MTARFSFLSFFALLIVAGIVAPIAIVLHELGHFFAFQYFGYSPVLHFDGCSVSGSHQIPSDSQAIVIAGAGIGFTVALSLLSLVVFYFVRHPIVFASGTVFAGRNIALLPLILFFGVDGGGDDRHLSDILGLPEWSLYILILAVNLVTIGLLVKFAGKNQKEMLMATIIGGIVGVALWWFWLGPSILP